jgi:hypothetical protein
MEALRDRLLRAVPLMREHQWFAADALESAADLIDALLKRHPFAWREEDVEPQRWAVFCENCKREWSVDYKPVGAQLCVECRNMVLSAAPKAAPAPPPDTGGIIDRGI